jgi:hypothetical protein
MFTAKQSNIVKFAILNFVTIGRTLNSAFGAADGRHGSLFSEFPAIGKPNKGSGCFHSTTALFIMIVRPGSVRPVRRARNLRKMFNLAKKSFFFLEIFAGTIYNQQSAQFREDTPSPKTDIVGGVRNTGGCHGRNRK